jgi:transposase
MRKEPVVKKISRWVGLDVHAETIAVAVAERDGEVRSLGIIPNTLESLRKLVRKLGPVEEVKACYEAGVTGFALYWQLERLGVACEVIAPTLVPRKAGDRVKTDRRDAEKLARSYRSGDLTSVWVPDADHEALRDLVRAREAAKKDQLRARHRLQKLLIRRGIRPPEGMKAWTEKHYKWVKSLTLEPTALEATRLDYVTEVEHVRERVIRLEKAIDEAIEKAPAQMRAVVEGLQALRGVAKVTAATIVAELGNLSRFESPRQLMGYSGAVPREHSSGGSISRGPITKTGNSHLRRVIVESSWAYKHKPGLYLELKRRQANISEEVKAISMKAQHRLHGRYRKLTARGKSRQQAATAVARELLGFIWAIATHIERQHEATAA